MDNLPQIRVTFYFTGDEFNVDEITEKMKILPSETREKESFPIKELAHTEWVMETGKDTCKAISLQFEKILILLKGKEKIINEICGNPNIDNGVLIDIFMKNGDKPEMLLTKEIITFLASINAEVGFDLYID